MFVVTLNKTSLKKVGAGALCCALVIFSAFLGRYISTRTVAAAAGVNRIESAQDIQTWFTGYGLDVDGTSITADKVKIPRKWDDSFSAFNGVVQQSGMDLTRYKGKTVGLRENPKQFCHFQPRASYEGRPWHSTQSVRFRQRLPYQGSWRAAARLRGCTKMGLKICKRSCKNT